MTAEQKRLERLHILATLAAHGPISGLEIVKRANNERGDELCDGRFDSLPDLTNRGIGSKLNGLWIHDLAEGCWPRDGSPMVWSITDFGRKLLAENGVVV